jgi:hypothetical protein
MTKSNAFGLRQRKLESNFSCKKFFFEKSFFESQPEVQFPFQIFSRVNPIKTKP